MGKSWLAKGAARPVFGQPSSDRTLENCPAPAAAREQHHERHAGTQPDRSLHGKIHFVFSFRGMGFPFVGYRVLRRDRRRFRKRTIDRKSTRLNSSHLGNSYAVLCLKKKTLDPPRDEDDETRRAIASSEPPEADR